MNASPMRMVSRAQRRELERFNQSLPLVLAPVPRATWPANPQQASNLAEVWRSRDFLVQVFVEPAGIERLSVNRTRLNLHTGRWDDGITWDDLQRLKRECGRGARCAVEVFPGDRDIVNVANLRHLWVLPEPPPFVWRALG